MIKSEKELRITRDWIKKFRESIATLEEELAESPDEITEISKRGFEYMLADFERQIREYDELKRSDPVIEAANVDELPKMLIRARIASGMTEKELAGMVGISEKELQRYEDFNYQDASYSKIREVAFVLKNKKPFVIYDEPAPAEIIK